MFTILNGGKLAGSNVKFSKFYLIIDPYEAVERGIDIDFVDSFIKF